MAKIFLIRIDGVNLGATVYDTDDLSTIRGASLALLRHAERWPERLKKYLPERLEVDIVVVGASDGIYRLTADWSLDDARNHVRAAIEKSTKPDGAEPDDCDLERTLPYLTFTWAAIEQGADYKNDVAELIARCRQMQLQQLTVDVPPASQPGAGTCPYDRTRPADTAHENQEGQTVIVSAATAARRSYGREARQKFYGQELKELTPEPEFGFADSFADLLKPVLPDGKIDRDLVNLPPALTGKMAAVYIDGNSFTKIRQETIFKPGENVLADAAAQARQTAFSCAVRSMRRRLLRALLDKLAEDPRMFFKPTDRQSKWDYRRKRLKFETLLWGGDEALFVLPAWKLMGLLPVLAAHLESDTWKLKLEIDGKIEDTGYQLTHAVGIVLCNLKTPIAVLRKLAEAVADGSKGLAKKAGGEKLPLTGLRNVYSIQILESVEPPRANLEAFRQQLYGTHNPAAFTLVGESGVEEFLKAARTLQAADGGLPRSQLYKLIQSAREQRLIGGTEKGAAPEAIEAFAKEIEKACQRSGCAHLNLLDSPHLGHTDTAPLMPLMRLAEFWDYLDPFDETESATEPGVKV